MAPVVRDSIASRSALSSGFRPSKLPATDTACTEACTVSLASTSVTVSVPDALITALVSVMPADTLSPPPTVMTGVSLVPSIVTVTSCDALPSEDTAVKLSVRDSPAASCWIAVWVLSAL